MSCPHCVRGFPLPGEPKGVLRTDLMLDAYLASPNATSEQWTPASRAVVLLTDIFGLNLPNPKLLADRFAQELGCDVWYFWILITRLPTVIRSRPSKAAARTTKFIEQIRAKYEYTSVGSIGYCWGGSLLYHIAQTHAIESAVIVHPGGYKDEQLKAIRVPVSWALAEDCDYIKQKQIDNAEAIFAARKGKDNFVEYEFKVYPGTAHGFAARPNLALPAVKEGFERAFEQAVNWFQKTLF
ncbi:Alpha/Beta hydrolase protein [Schizophyllum commune]